MSTGKTTSLYYRKEQKLGECFSPVGLTVTIKRKKVPFTNSRGFGYADKMVASEIIPTFDEKYLDMTLEEYTTQRKEAQKRSEKRRADKKQEDENKLVKFLEDNKITGAELLELTYTLNKLS
mgnify:CR=1 FL=1